MIEKKEQRLVVMVTCDLSLSVELTTVMMILLTLLLTLVVVVADVRSLLLPFP